MSALDHYIACAVWSSTDEDGNPLDDTYGPDDLSDEARATMSAELDDFTELVEREHVDRSAWTDEQLAHDLWLTRNRHGAGFWDRGHGATADRLTELAHAYGEQWVYVGDDGRLHVQ